MASRAALAATSPYHHGDLRAELIRLALSRIETLGHEKLELRSLAQLAGVSVGAPYRHFSSRDELLAELIRYGFNELSQHNEIILQTPAAPQERLRQACESYVAFASRRPQLYRLMFASELVTVNPDAHDIRTVGDQCFELFVATVAACMADKAGRNAKLEALAYWTGLHGYAMLRLTGRLTFALPVGCTEDTLFEAIVGRRLQT